MCKYIQVESFHLNGHIIGFGPQTHKLESPYKTPSSALAMKGLKTKKNSDQGVQFQVFSIF